MNTVPLISVVIPSHNSPDIFLTLDSVLIQDYPRIQLVIVDDASDTFPAQRIREYLELHNKGNLEKIDILQNPQNQGTVYTMNLAYRHCLGEYLFTLASDDCFYDGQVLSDWVNAFIRSGAQVMTAYRAIYDTLLRQHICTAPSPEQVQSIKTATTQELFEEIARTNYIFGCCTARTADCIRKHGLYDTRYRLLEDHPMNLKLLRQGERIHFFDRVVVKYRSGGTSAAINYNPAYAADVDTVLKSDVLPYTKHPLRMRWFYFQWKRDQKLLKKRADALEKYKNHRLMQGLIQLFYYLHHPLRTLSRIPKRVLQKMKEMQ